MSDFNTRFGETLTEMNSADYIYRGMADHITRANRSAEIFSSLLRDNNMVILNNLETHSNYFQSDLTFKNRRTHWVSEIDLCSISLFKSFDNSSFEICDL